MKFVNCAVGENIHIEAVIDSGANINVIKQKIINELGLAYDIESNSIEAPDVSYSALGKVNLHIGFNDGENRKNIPAEFIVLRPGLPDYYPDLILGAPWLRENSATIDICNSKLSLDDNFAIPIYFFD